MCNTLEGSSKSLRKGGGRNILQGETSIKKSDKIVIYSKGKAALNKQTE